MRIAIFFAFASVSFAQQLPGTQPLTPPADPAAKMVEGIRAYLLRATDASLNGRKPDRERLRYLIGAVDPRLPFAAPGLDGSVTSPAKIAETVNVEVFAVRWPVLDGVTAEGLYFRPKGAVAARVVLLPDADGQPEQSSVAWRLASSGCEVVVPALIDRNDRWSGNPKFRMTSQPHREYIYRMAFPVGRHIIGYEVQKALAAVDWFAKQAKRPIVIWGQGEGGLLALYTAAIDQRIDVAVVGGYFESRQKVREEPIYRNIWGQLKDFGDAEIASLIAPRKLIVETTRGPETSGPSTADPKRTGGAPGVLVSPTPEAARLEAERARKLGANIEVVSDAAVAFQRALGIRPGAPPADVPALPAHDRQQSQVRELVEHAQRMVRDSEAVRNAYWAKADTTSPERWLAAVKPFKERFREDVIGPLPKFSVPMTPRSRKSYSSAKWDGYEITLDLYPDVFAYGVLLLPKDIRPGERRPVVVCQHGLNGRPQSMFGQEENEVTDYRHYRNIGAKLADMGFIVYLPQNPYTGDFRDLNRSANPVKLTMFAFILAQHERLLDWLSALPQVDSRRIGFYGLSYGGKTALRIPALAERYALSICSGDFNEWIYKLTTVDAGYTYMFTAEYEIGEYDLGSIANHAEMAWMIAPRPFMVERGHRDGVGVDEWVSYEYAKVRRLYDEMGIGDRTRIEYFNGPHRINGQGTVEFLKKFLRWGK